MTTGALIMMILVQFSVTVITVYFFIRVWKSPPKTEPPDPEIKT